MGVMRETIMTAARKATDELFPRSAAGEFLNCYMSSTTNNQECQQLNCYDGYNDALFHSKVKLLSARMQARASCADEVTKASLGALVLVPQWLEARRREQKGADSIASFL